VALADVLAQVISVQIEDDGALTMLYQGTVASLREVAIADGLTLVSLTQVLAWDLPCSAALRERVAAQTNKTMLGTVAMSEQPESRVDVMLRYNFPVDGLQDQALQTLVLMVLDGGVEVRRALTGA
jgi:hypothetical protein